MVEKLRIHKRQELTALFNTMMKVWDKLDTIKLMNVFERWKLVLALILKDDDGDRCIESNRGKFFCAPSREVEYLGKEYARRTTDADNLPSKDTLISTISSSNQAGRGKIATLLSMCLTLTNDPLAIFETHFLQIKTPFSWLTIVILIAKAIASASCVII